MEVNFTTDLIVIIFYYSIGFISMICSSFLILVFIFNKKSRSYPFELNCYLSIALFTTNLSYIIYFMLIRDSIESINNVLCNIQAFLMTFGEISQFVWTTIIGITIYKKIVEFSSDGPKKGTNEYIKLKVSRRIKSVLFGFLFPLILSLILLFLNVFGKSNHWCWLATEKYYNNEESKSSFNNIITDSKIITPEDYYSNKIYLLDLNSNINLDSYRFLSSSSHLNSDNTVNRIVYNMNSENSINFDLIHKIIYIYYGLIWFLMLINYSYVFSTIKFLRENEDQDEKYVEKYIKTLIQFPIIQLFIVFPQTLSKFLTAIGYTSQFYPSVAVCLMSIQGICYTVSYGFNNYVKDIFKGYLCCIFCCKKRKINDVEVPSIVKYRDTLGQNINETKTEINTSNHLYHRKSDPDFSNISDYYSESEEHNKTDDSVNNIKKEDKCGSYYDSNGRGNENIKSSLLQENKNILKSKKSKESNNFNDDELIDQMKDHKVGVDSKDLGKISEFVDYRNSMESLYSNEKNEDLVRQNNI